MFFCSAASIKKLFDQALGPLPGKTKEKTAKNETFLDELNDDCWNIHHDLKRVAVSTRSWFYAEAMVLHDNVVLDVVSMFEDHFEMQPRKVFSFVLFLLFAVQREALSGKTLLSSPDYRLRSCQMLNSILKSTLKSKH
jgi:hypothetical protein